MITAAEREAVGDRRRMSEIIQFTIVAVACYWLSDRLLDLVERRRGERFQHRSLIFFAILLVLAMSSFYLMRRILGA
jgi:hypothetical protein